MHQLLLHDPNRSPADWTAWVGESQFAVFLSDVQLRGELDVNGQPISEKRMEVCYVFDSLAEAEAFCIEKAASHDRMFCEIYDRRGKAADAVRVFTHPSAGRLLPNRRSARWMLGVAWLLLPAAAVLFWIDYRHDGLLVFPTVVGLACFFTWLRLLWWGYAEMSMARDRDKPAADTNTAPEQEKRNE